MKEAHCITKQVKSEHCSHLKYRGMLPLYQCLLYCSRSDSSNRDILIAASGSYIQTFNASDGVHLSTWPPGRSRGTSPQTRTDPKTFVHHRSGPSADSEISQRPQKRRKLSSTSSRSSTEIIVEDGPRDTGCSGMDHLSKNWITKLACDASGQHLVTVTGEDKTLRVYDLSVGGVLSLFSER